MRYFVARRIRNLTLCLPIIALIYYLDLYMMAALIQAGFYTGWALFIIIIFLAAYNLRKKIPVIPLGSASSWTQFHIYVGLISGVIFLCHIHFKMPNGIFELLLAGLFAGTFTSGVFGLILTRILPIHLNSRGEKVIYERIPSMIRMLREESEALALKALKETESTTVSKFYSLEIAPFFNGPRNFRAHLFGSRAPLRSLEQSIEYQQRFCNAAERKFMTELLDRVRVKDELDFQYSGQAILKWWLFIHIPLTYALIGTGLYHAVLVHAFLGGP